MLTSHGKFDGINTTEKTGTKVFLDIPGNLAHASMMAMNIQQGKKHTNKRQYNHLGKITTQKKDISTNLPKNDQMWCFLQYQSTGLLIAACASTATLLAETANN